MAEPVDSQPPVPVNEASNPELYAKGQRFESAINRTIDGAVTNKRWGVYKTKDEERFIIRQSNRDFPQIPHWRDEVGRSLDGNVVKWVKSEYRFDGYPQFNISWTIKKEGNEIIYTRQTDREREEYRSSNPEHQGKIDEILDIALRQIEPTTVESNTPTPQPTSV